MYMELYFKVHRLIETCSDGKSQFLSTHCGVKKFCSKYKVTVLNCPFAANGADAADTSHRSCFLRDNALGSLVLAILEKTDVRARVPQIEIEVRQDTVPVIDRVVP